MRPISRAAAAIQILDKYLAGNPVEIALKGWFKSNRFAGSNDRYLIRDMVFDILRKKSSLIFPFQINGYPENGRLLILSYLADHYELVQLSIEIKQNSYFYEKLSSDEITILSNKKKIMEASPKSITFDYPSFLSETLFKSLGNSFESIMEKMQERAPLYLRINMLKANSFSAEKILAADGIFCTKLSESNTALVVNQGRKLVKSSEAYTSGTVEIQDLSSQLMTDLPQITSGVRILDYCAGGGGKTLAIASKTMNKADLVAYDINPNRLTNLKKRVIRAGANIKILKTLDLEEYKVRCDVVFVDAPCSGSGIWRRDPEVKWTLSEKKLKKFQLDQAGILREASRFVKIGGVIVYAVCSLLPEEGETQIKEFLEVYKNFVGLEQSLLHPLVASDGFFRAVLKKVSSC